MPLTRANGRPLLRIDVYIVKMSDVPYNEEEVQLLAQIGEEIKKLSIFDAQRENNCYKGQERGDIENYLVTDDAFVEMLKETKLEDNTDDTITVLQNEIEVLKNDLATVASKLQEEKQERERLTNNLETLKEILESKSSSEEDDMCKNIEQIEKNIKIAFKKEKQQLKTVITTLFPDNSDIQDLIADVIQTYFSEGPDKYRQLEYKEGLLEQLKLLEDSCLFQIHPHDPLQVKLVQLT